MSVQKEDVYETEDLPLSEEPNDNEETFEDPGVEKIHVDVEGAMKLFGHRVLNSDNVDFSDSLNNRRRRGYRSGHYVLEVVGPESGEKETTEQKFQRLRCELEELIDTVGKEKENKEEVSSISKAELDGLSDLLKAATLKCEKVGNVPPKGSSSASTKAMGSESVSKSTDAKNLDERIKRIEQAVCGQDRLTPRSHHEPLIEAVENLRIQVESLNPAYLDGVSSHLNGAIAKLTELDDKRSKTHTDEVEQKVDKLYQLVTDWDVTCSNVPAIVKRLHSLSKLHEQAQEFSSKLNDVTGLKQHLEKKTENHKVMLFELKRETTKFVHDFSTKIQNLEQRMAALQK